MRTIRHRGPIVRTHPLTGLPLLPLGKRRDGSLIWPIMGGSEDAGGDAGGEGGEGGDQGGTGGDAGKPGDEGKSDEGKTSDAEKVDELPAWAQKVIRDSRDGEAKARTAKAAAAEEARKAVLADIATALGGDEGAKAPTVEELTKQLADQTTQTSETTSALRDAKAELVVWRNAVDLKADAQALTDSRAFASAIADLDPSSKTFEEDVKKAAKEAVEKNPKLAAVQAAGSSSADHGGPGGGASKKPQSLDAAVGSHYGT